MSPVPVFSDAADAMAAVRAGLRFVAAADAAQMSVRSQAKTSTKGCVLLCWFRHQVVIHRWGWTLALNPDGTTTAWNKDKTKVLHSHGPPARPG